MPLDFDVKNERLNLFENKFSLCCHFFLELKLQIKTALNPKRFTCLYFLSGLVKSLYLHIQCKIEQYIKEIKSLQTTFIIGTTLARLLKRKRTVVQIIKTQKQILGISLENRKQNSQPLALTYLYLRPKWQSCLQESS